MFIRKNVDPEGQLDLLNNDASFKTAETTEEKNVVEEIHYKRKKRTGYKAELTQSLPVKEIHCELTGEYCTCDWCNSQLRPIGKSYVREEVVFVPATMYKKAYYQHAYECTRCKKDGKDVIQMAQFRNNRSRIVWIHHRCWHNCFIKRLN